MSLNTSNVVERYGPRIVWPLIFLCSIILIVFVVIRSVAIFGSEAPPGLFEARYLDHPVLAIFHMVAGIAFVAFAPLQFLKKFRSRNITVHRWLGRVLLLCALIAGIYGIVSAIVLPVFGGVSSEAAVWFFGPIFLFSLLRAYWCVRNKAIAQHREWMIRAFALGLAVGTQRLFLLIFLPLTGYSFEELFGPGLWVGFSGNLLIAEIWINVSRSRGKIDK